MTILDWIIFGLVIAAAVVLLFLLIQKWGKLQRLDLDAMPQAKLRKRKYQLIESRLQRRANDAKSLFSRASGGKSVGGALHSWYDKLHELERRYRSATVDKDTDEDKEKTRQKVATLIDEGQQAIKEDNIGEAEHIFLDVIRLNPQYVEAYEYLGEIYIQKKEYDHAIETLEYALKLSPNDDRLHYDLATVYLEQQNLDKAMDFAKQAVELAPNHPKNLDMQLDIALKQADKLTALETFRKLKEVNPDNKKLDALDQQIKDL